MSKQRIIFVPQYPTKMRYPEWWMPTFTRKFDNAGFDVITLGEDYADMMAHRRGTMSMFSPVHSAIEFECAQINEYMELKLKDDDILFLADLSFPGLFANVLHHKRPKKCFAFCHATSINNYDYFSKVKNSKFTVETGQAKMFDLIFVGSEYHGMKLLANGWMNLKVTYVPEPPPDIMKPVTRKKKHFLISVARPTPQKKSFHIERMIETHYGKIFNKRYNKWQTYYEALCSSKALLITAKEETFGYPVLEAIRCGCIPVVPNSFSYPELVSREYRYDNMAELYNILDKIKYGELQVPKLLCETRTKNFFNNIIKIMQGGEDYPF